MEQFGRVITEGQAAGCVVVGWDTGSIAEVGQGWALLSEEGDVRGLAEHVVRLRAEQALYERLRQGGLERAATATWAAVAAGQAELYRAVLSSTVEGAAQAGRAAAVQQFGPPARAAGTDRPFALPVLREDNAATRALGRIVDLAAARRRG